MCKPSPIAYWRRPCRAPAPGVSAALNKRCACSATRRPGSCSCGASWPIRMPSCGRRRQRPSGRIIPTKSEPMTNSAAAASSKPLDAPPIDAPIPLMHFLRHLQIPDEPHPRPCCKQLEAPGPTECPLCKKTLTHGERGAHLHAEHGSLLYEGDLLPAEAVFARLWERVLHQQDRQAMHDELVGDVPEPAGRARTPTPPSNVTSATCRDVLLGEMPSDDEPQAIPVALPYAAILAYLNHAAAQRSCSCRSRGNCCCRHNGACASWGARRWCPTFRSSCKRVPASQNCAACSPFCPDLDQTDQQIDLCRQLAQLGADQALINTCIVELQEERLVVCSECRAEVQTKDLELHLRRAHQIFQFRGVRRDLRGDARGHRAGGLLGIAGCGCLAQSAIAGGG